MNRKFKSLINQSHLLTQQMSHSFDKKVNALVKRLNKNSEFNLDEDTHSTSREIKDIIQALKNNKAPGFMESRIFS